MHLEIGPRRATGFHDVFGVFQAVSLRDRVTVRASGADGACSVTGAFDCAPAETSLAKAVSAFRQETGVRSGVEVEVLKRIPAGAGLGGGSSDAASCLRCLDALFGTRLAARSLARLCAEVGSDVPFFLAPSGVALVSGRGEQVRPLRARRAFGVLIVWPGVPSPTAKAFAALDGRRASAASHAAPGVPPSPRGTSWPARARMAWNYALPSSRWPFTNDFQSSVAVDLPEVARLLDLLAGTGSDYVAMTGSGSACFAVFEGLREAEGALREFGRGLRGAFGPAAFAGAFETLASRPSLMYNP